MHGRIVVVVVANCFISISIQKSNNSNELRPVHNVENVSKFIIKTRPTLITLKRIDFMYVNGSKTVEIDAWSQWHTYSNKR